MLYDNEIELFKMKQNKTKQNKTLSIYTTSLNANSLHFLNVFEIIYWGCIYLNKNTVKQ